MVRAEIRDLAGGMTQVVTKTQELESAMEDWTEQEGLETWDEEQEDDTSINVTQRRYPQRHDMFLRARHLIKTLEPEKTKTHDAQQKACPTHLRH